MPFAEKHSEAAFGLHEQLDMAQSQHTVLAHGFWASTQYWKEGMYYAEQLRMSLNEAGASQRQDQTLFQTGKVTMP